MGYAIIAFLIVFLLLASGLLLLFHRDELGRRLSNVLVERGRRPGFVERFKRTQTGDPQGGFAELIRRSAPGGNKAPAVQQRLTLAGYRQAFHRKLFSASKVAVPALLVVLAAVTGLYQWNAFLVFVSLRASATCCRIIGSSTGSKRAPNRSSRVCPTCST